MKGTEGGGLPHAKLKAMLAQRSARLLWSVDGPDRDVGEGWRPGWNVNVTTTIEAWEIPGRPVILVHVESGGAACTIYMGDVLDGPGDLDLLLGPTEAEIARDEQDRADHQIHIVVDQDLDDPLSLAVFVADAIHKGGDRAQLAKVAERIRRLAVAESAIVGGDALPLWNITRVPEPSNGEEVSCLAELNSNGERYRIDVRGGIAHVAQYLPTRIAGWHEIGSSTWQGGLSDTDADLDAHLDARPGLDGDIEAAVRAACPALIAPSDDTVTCSRCGREFPKGGRCTGPGYHP